MGVVVLHADELHLALLLLRQAHFVERYSGWRSWAITSRLDVEHGEVEVEIGAERLVGELGVEVAEMRREERLAAAGDAERALQLGPDRDSGRAAATGSGTPRGETA